MIGEDAFHVQPSIHGGWLIKRVHHHHGIWFHVKADAVKEARRMAREAGLSLYIHLKDGTICEKIIRAQSAE